MLRQCRFMLGYLLRDIFHGFNAGASDYLRKPVKQRDIKKIIEEYLSHDIAKSREAQI